VIDGALEAIEQRTKLQARIETETSAAISANFGKLQRMMEDLASLTDTLLPELEATEESVKKEVH
jgi:hypothetical protein